MKLIHVLKRLEIIDRDVAELRKFTEELASNRTYSNALKISLELQINNLLNEKVKLMDLKIENPPAYLLEQKVEESVIQSTSAFNFEDHEHVFLPKLFQKNQQNMESDHHPVPIIAPPNKNIKQENESISSLSLFSNSLNITHNNQTNLLTSKEDTSSKQTLDSIPTIDFKKTAKNITGGSLLKRLTSDKKTISEKIKEKERADDLKHENEKREKRILNDLPSVEY